MFIAVLFIRVEKRKQYMFNILGSVNWSTWLIRHVAVNFKKHSKKLEKISIQNEYIV